MDADPCHSIRWGTTEQNIQYVTEVVQEAIRIRRQYPHLKVLPYIWYAYHSGSEENYANTPLTRIDLDINTALPRMLGADGLIAWQLTRPEGEFAEGPGPWRDNYQKYISDVLTPYLQEQAKDWCLD